MTKACVAVLTATTVLMHAMEAAGGTVTVVLGESDPSLHGGTMFWRPGVTIATGAPGHVLQVRGAFYWLHCTWRR